MNENLTPERAEIDETFETSQETAVVEKVELSEQELRGAVEAILMVTDSPVSLLAIAAALETPVNQVRNVVQALQADLDFFERLLPAGDQPIQVRALQAALADGGLQAAGKECIVNALGLVKTPNAGTDFGAGAKCCPPQKTAAVAFHTHRFTRISAALGNRAVKYPRMAAQR